MVWTCSPFEAKIRGYFSSFVRARSIGAQNSKEEVLVFLDAHCEPEPNWLPPLLAPIARNDRVSTVPMIDGIDGNKYTFSSQGLSNIYVLFTFEGYKIYTTIIRGWR